MEFLACRIWTSLESYICDMNSGYFGVIEMQVEACNGGKLCEKWRQIWRQILMETVKDGSLLHVTDNMAKVSRPLWLLLIIFSFFHHKNNPTSIWMFSGTLMYSCFFFLCGYQVVLYCLLLNCSPSFDTASLSRKDNVPVWPARWEDGASRSLKTLLLRSRCKTEWDHCWNIILRHGSKQVSTTKTRNRKPQSIGQHSASYPGSPKLKYRPWDRLFWQRFCVDSVPQWCTTFLSQRGLSYSRYTGTQKFVRVVLISEDERYNVPPIPRASLFQGYSFIF